MNLAIYWVHIYWGHIYWVQRFFELLAGNRVHARLRFWAQMDLKKGGFYVTRVTALSKVALCCTALFMWFYLAAKLRYGLMVSHALVFGSSGPSPRPGRRHCIVFLRKAPYFHSASLHPERKMCASKPEDNVLSSILPPVFLT